MENYQSEHDREVIYWTKHNQSQYHGGLKKNNTRETRECRKRWRRLRKTRVKKRGKTVKEATKKENIEEEEGVISNFKKGKRLEVS